MKSRYELIDSLRGIAVLFVVLLHLQLRIPFEETALFGSLPNEIWSFFFRSGNNGVRIFFVISGFLITTMSLRRWGNLKNLDCKSFYLFRFARIAPPLILLLFVLTVLHFSNTQHYVINKDQVSYTKALFAALTFHINWLEGQVGYLPASWDILWSLSVEEVFYLFFPLICIFCRKQWLLLLCLSLFILIGPFYRVSTASNEIWSSKAYLSCMDSIAFGCITALLIYGKTYSKNIVNIFGITGSTLMMFVLLFKREAFFKPLAQLQIDETILSLGTALLLIYCVQKPASKLTQSLVKPFTFYGVRSYEIYLTHIFIVFLGVDLYKKFQQQISPFLILILVVVGSGVLGYLIEKFYSGPLNKFIRSKPTSTPSNRL